MLQNLNAVTIDDQTNSRRFWLLLRTTFHRGNFKFQAPPGSVRTRAETIIHLAQSITLYHND